jgi:hypothetical protein
MLVRHPNSGFRYALNNEHLSVILAGNLARFEARAVVVEGQVTPFPVVNLAFAWTQAPNAPLILGQANFLFEFDVCFSHSRSEFEVRPSVVERKWRSWVSHGLTIRLHTNRIKNVLG